LNRGRHLCSAGRPSRWALAHILVGNVFIVATMLLSIGYCVLTFNCSQSARRWYKNSLHLKKINHIYITVFIIGYEPEILK